MIIFRYDNTFNGLLSAVFDAFSLKKWPDDLLSEADIIPLLADEVHNVKTEAEKFNRVSLAMKKRIPAIVLNQLTYVWFTEQATSRLLIFRYLVKIFKTRHTITTDFNDIDVLALRNLAKKVSHECHYLMMFVRFKAINNQGQDLYFATVDPKYNVLSLTIDFFRDRFADQQWAIFDTKRAYGYFYDLNRVDMITLNAGDDLVTDGGVNCHYFSDEEKQLQTLWSAYCQSITIEARLNPKLQRQLMPKRFWKHLPELNG